MRCVDLGAAARVWGPRWGVVVGTVFCLWRVLVRFLGCAGGGPASGGGELLGCSRAGMVRVARWCAVCGPGVCVLGFGPVGVGGYR